MQVLHFFPTDPRTGTPVGMEIWLGNLGPLQAHTVMPTAHPSLFSQTNNVGAVQPFPQGPTIEAGFVRVPQPNGTPGAIAGPSSGAAPDPNVINGADEASNPPLPGTGRHTSLDPPGTRRTTDPVMIISVEMPPMPTILSAIRELSTPPPNGAGPNSNASGSNNGAGPSNASNNQTQYFVPPPPPPPGGVNQSGGQGGMPGRAALPIIFVRPYDLVGYMTGYSIACENVFSGNGMGDPGLTGAQGWTLRVV